MLRWKRLIEFRARLGRARGTRFGFGEDAASFDSSEDTDCLSIDSEGISSRRAISTTASAFPACTSRSSSPSDNFFKSVGSTWGFRSSCDSTLTRLLERRGFPDSIIKSNTTKMIDANRVLFAFSFAVGLTEAQVRYFWTQKIIVPLFSYFSKGFW